MPQSVRRAAEILTLFSPERPDLGPSEVAEQLGVARSSAHALLQDLTAAGLTERLPCGRYRLGWATVGLARTRLALDRAIGRAATEARRLAGSTGETVRLGARAGDEVHYLLTARPPGGVRTSDAPVAAAVTPLGAALAPGAEAGYRSGAHADLAGVECLAAPVAAGGEPAGAALALCGSRERIESRRDAYGRAVERAARRAAAPVR